MVGCEKNSVNQWVAESVKEVAAVEVDVREGVAHELFCDLV